MAFILRCLATDDIKNPIGKRCNNAPDAPNGLLCRKHTKLAKEKPIHILMHHQVSKVFKIPFKNQICVEIDLRKKKDLPRPESKTAIDEKKRDIKNLLIQDMQQFSITKLKEFHDALKLNCWEKMKKEKNEYAFRFFMSKLIIDTFESYSNVKAII
jgi:hypothetical protein